TRARTTRRTRPCGASSEAGTRASPQRASSRARAAGRWARGRRWRRRMSSAPTVVCLPGDGIGPEITEVAKRALAALAPDVRLVDAPIGAAAIRATGSPLPAETLALCRTATAVLKAPVGDPEFDAADVRPEQGLLALRAELDTYANLRPAVQGPVDLLVV